MKLTILIKQLEQVLAAHGDHEVMVEVPGDEQNVDHVESFISDADDKRYTYVSAVDVDPTRD